MLEGAAWPPFLCTRLVIRPSSSRPRRLRVLHGVAATGPQTQRTAARSPQVRPIGWAEATPLVVRLEQVLPESLRAIPPSERPARWPEWLANRRNELAARVAQGDEDSVVNLLLFGTSFTKEPRITSSLLKELDQRGRPATHRFRTRSSATINDGLPIWSRPPPIPARVRECSEVRRVLATTGHDLSTPAGRRSSIDYLFASLARVREEAARLAADLEAVRRVADATTISPSARASSETVGSRVIPRS